MSNHCGISTLEILQHIRNVVERQPNFVSKKDIISALVTGNFNGNTLSVAEANEIANLYYLEYKYNLKKNIKKKLRGFNKVLKKYEKEYLSFEEDSKLLTDEEIKYIRKE